MTREQIAIGIGIDPKTLDKHYEAELSTVAYAKRLEVLAAMHEAALKGNVAAQKAYLALEPKLAAPPVPEEDAPAGKKEQQKAEAKVAHVGTDWERDLEPRTLN